MTVSVIIAVLALLFLIYVNIKTYKNLSELRSVIPLPFLICYEIGLIHMIISLFVLSLTNFGIAPCMAYEIFKGFGSIYIACSILCVFGQINTVLIIYIEIH